MPSFLWRQCPTAARNEKEEPMPTGDTGSSLQKTPSGCFHTNEGAANHEIHDEAAPLFYYKCEGKLQKRVHMLPVPEAMKSFCSVPFLYWYVRKSVLHLKAVRIYFYGHL